MRLWMMVAVLVMLAGPAWAETRCGWLESPQPDSWALRDAEGRWEIASASGYRAEGMDYLSDLAGEQYVEIGQRGFTCGCMQVHSDRAARRVLAITKMTQKPLKTCLGDTALPYPER